jgi:hypothetical protein
LYKPGKPCVFKTVEKDDSIPEPFKKPSCACILVLIVSKGWPTATDLGVERVEWKEERE